MTWAKFKDEAERRQKEIEALNKELQNKAHEYKAFTKRYLGIADGDQMNVVVLADAVKKIMDLHDVTKLSEIV